MLGLTLECARCHDHKFDAITQRDYFSLFAFFNSIDESGCTRTSPTPRRRPSMLLWPAHEQAAHAAVQRRIAATEARLARLATQAEPAFLAWRTAVAASDASETDASARRPYLRPVAHLAFDAIDGDTTPDSVAKTGATLQDGPVLVDDPEATGGKALRFSGDNAVVHPSLREFSRTDAFSIALRVKPSEKLPRAVVLHQSRAWTDAGSRGFELTLDDGRPFFGVIHFWPGNAAAVRARDALPLGAWSSLVITYDGLESGLWHRALRERLANGRRCRA